MPPAAVSRRNSAVNAWLYISAARPGCAPKLRARPVVRDLLGKPAEELPALAPTEPLPQGLALPDPLPDLLRFGHRIYLGNRRPDFGELTLSGLDRAFDLAQSI